jgi:proteasome component ECM29
MDKLWTLKTYSVFSLGAVISLAKEAGAALKPHLAFLIPCLLESLSETEPTVLNYLAARSTGEQLEAVRTECYSSAERKPFGFS